MHIILTDKDFYMILLSGRKDGKITWLYQK
jgi:hypothetical protein